MNTPYRQQINIALVGPVSAGKSTFTNAIFVSQYSDCHIKRTTALPQVYYEVGDTNQMSDLASIRETNRDANTAIMAKTASGAMTLTIKDIKEVPYQVPLLFNMLKTVRQKDVFYTIYDLPGLNDSSTKDVYHQYVKQSFHKFDIVVFVIDIKSALNTSDEMDMLKAVLKGLKANHITYGITSKLIVLLNKCDEMDLHRGGIPTPSDPEIFEMYEQVKTVVDKQRIDIFPAADISIACVSMEDAYIYRSYQLNPKGDIDEKYLNKFGANEYGKGRWARLSTTQKKLAIAKMFKTFDFKEVIGLSGFTNFDMVLSNALTPKKQFVYLINHAKYEITMVKDPLSWDIKDDIDRFDSIRINIKFICDKFNETAASYTKLVDARVASYMLVYTSVNIPNGLGVIDSPSTATYNIMTLIRNLLHYVAVKLSLMSIDITGSINSVEKNMCTYHTNAICDNEIDYIEFLDSITGLFECGCEVDTIIRYAKNMHTYAFITTDETMCSSLSRLFTKYPVLNSHAIDIIHENIMGLLANNRFKISPCPYMVSVCERVYIRSSSRFAPMVDKIRYRASSLMMMGHESPPPRHPLRPYHCLSKRSSTNFRMIYVIWTAS